MFVGVTESVHLSLPEIAQEIRPFDTLLLASSSSSSCCCCCCNSSEWTVYSTFCFILRHDVIVLPRECPPVTATSYVALVAS